MWSCPIGGIRSARKRFEHTRARGEQAPVQNGIEGRGCAPYAHRPRSIVSRLFQGRRTFVGHAPAARVGLLFLVPNAHHSKRRLVNSLYLHCRTAAPIVLRLLDVSTLRMLEARRRQFQVCISFLLPTPLGQIAPRVRSLATLITPAQRIALRHSSLEHALQVASQRQCPVAPCTCPLSGELSDSRPQSVPPGGCGAVASCGSGPHRRRHVPHSSAFALIWSGVYSRVPSPPRMWHRRRDGR